MRIYCERVSDGLLAEPANVLSSFGFVLAALLVYRMHKSSRALTGPMPELMILLFLATCMAIGSALFHSLSTMGSILFDVVPIFFFVLFYLYVFARNLLGLSAVKSVAMFAVLAAGNLIYKYHVFRAADGYISYIPTFIFLATLALYMLIRRHPSAKRVLLASCIAFASLYLRIVDRQWCGAWPMGTHFLWHLCSALVVYILMRELVVYKRMKASHS